MVEPNSCLTWPQDEVGLAELLAVRLSRLIAAHHT